MRAISDLTLLEREQFRVLVKSALPHFPKWKIRPLPVDIEQALTACILNDRAAELASFQDALLGFGIPILNTSLEAGPYSFECGNTPLHIALAMGAKKVTAYLLQAGANPNLLSPSPHECRPLQAAIIALQEDMIRLLLDAGADPSLPDGQGRTAYDHAEDIAFRWHWDGARNLLKGGSKT